MQDADTFSIFSQHSPDTILPTRFSVLQAQQDAEAAAEAAAIAKQASARLSPGQLQRLKARNQDLMQRRAVAASAKQRKADERVSRLEAIQEQVIAATQCAVTGA